MKAVPMPEVAVLDDARTDIIVSLPRVRDEGRSEIGHIQPQVPDGGRWSNTALASSLLGRSAYLAGMVDDPPIGASSGLTCLVHTRMSLLAWGREWHIHMRGGSREASRLPVPVAA